MSMVLKIEDQTKRIADLESKLAEHKRDAELCRELRALLQRKAGTEYVFSSYPVSGLGVSGDVRNLMLSIRDGGAK